jgi:hypothetical protein
MIEETRKNLKVNRDVSLSEVADLSILREAQRELGIKIKGRCPVRKILRALLIRRTCGAC